MPTGSGADTSSTKLSYVPEYAAGGDTTLWGTTPAAALTAMRITSESLDSDKETVQSQEIRPDRMIADLIEVGVAARGSVGFELSYGAHDPFLASIMGSTWGTHETNTVTTTFDNGTSKITGTGVAAGFLVGDIIRIVDSDSNDGFFEITVKTSNDDIDVLPAPVDEVATASVTLDTQRLKMGILTVPFSLEKEFTDLTPGTLGKFLVYKGMFPGQLQLQFNARRILTGSMEFMGRQAVSRDTTIGTGSAIAAPTNDIMAASAGIGTIYEGGEALSTALLGLQFTLNPNLRPKPQVGSKYPYGIGLGSLVLTGQVDAYYENETLFKRSLDHETTGLWFPVFDLPTDPTAGNAYAFNMRKVKFATGGAPQSAGINQDVRQRLNFQAILDPTTSSEMAIFRFAAA